MAIAGAQTAHSVETNVINYFPFIGKYKQAYDIIFLSVWVFAIPFVTEAYEIIILSVCPSGSLLFVSVLSSSKQRTFKLHYIVNKGKYVNGFPKVLN
jgi:hypothetical protein